MAVYQWGKRLTLQSDLVINMRIADGRDFSIGVSTKQCSNSNPTNAQLYFTTANGFATLPRNNGLTVSDHAVRAMRQFCGDVGFRPMDGPVASGRQTDMRRWFWEEIDTIGRVDWEGVVSQYQDLVSRLLLQKAYLEDLESR